MVVATAQLLSGKSDGGCVRAVACCGKLRTPASRPELPAKIPAHLGSCTPLPCLPERPGRLHSARMAVRTMPSPLREPLGWLWLLLCLMYLMAHGAAARHPRLTR